MGLQLVRVPREIHSAEEGSTPLFNSDAVEWAMKVVLNP
jgi:hypothetical protein